VRQVRVLKSAGKRVDAEAVDHRAVGLPAGNFGRPPGAGFLRSDGRHSLTPVWSPSSRWSGGILHPHHRGAHVPEPLRESLVSGCPNRFHPNSADSPS
jgi:hypothetical protein